MTLSLRLISRRIRQLGPTAWFACRSSQNANCRSVSQTHSKLNNLASSCLWRYDYALVLGI